ncbi:hypothetical protein RvY_01436-2 [Ramazzottius varieornatus]|uniref:Chitin-binding type-2 domain-containing protein n=1 Tax=Ramazzottius varieornatus TaxID=947166 RepID=A0A1D1UR13_RAMVA|nr:hypothetical protein RvY_01436-2 [Ramazzottius varieornatus]
MRRATFVLMLITAVLIPLSFCGKMSSRRRPHPSRRKPSSMEVSDSNLIQESVPSYETYEYLSKYYSFSCAPLRKTGYYGDPLYDCRIFHVCHLSGQATFFCPALTKFNNYLQICDWEQKIDKNCEPYPMTEEPEHDRFLNYHPIDHYPLSPVPLTVKYVPAPQYVSVTSEEQHYRNKYKEVQEYYGPFKNRAPRNPKASLMLLPQPLFNYVNGNPRYNGKEFYQEDEKSKASQEVTPSPTARTATEEDKAAESKQSKQVQADTAGLQKGKVLLLSLPLKDGKVVRQKWILT